MTRTPSEIPRIDVPEGVLVKEDRKRSSKPKTDRAEKPETVEPAETTPDAVKAPTEPAPEKRQRSRDTDRSSEPRSRGGRKNHRRNDGPPVIGMGDHMPAFLLREIRPKKSTTEATVEPVAEAVIDEGDSESNADAA